MSAIKSNHLSALMALVILTSIPCNSEKCELWNRVELPYVDTYSNESVWDSENQNLYPPSSYWESTDNNGTSKLYGCPCKLDKPCMRKCCQKNEVMDFYTLKCIPHNATWPWFRPNVTADEEGNYRMEDFYYFGLTFGNYCFGYLLEPQFYPEDDKFYVNFTDGTLAIFKLNKTGLGPKDYCLAYFPDEDVYLPYVCLSSLGSEYFQPTLDMCSKLRYVLYPIGKFISVIFLIISICLHIFIPELRNFYGKCLMCYMTSLVFAYSFLATVEEFGSSLPDNVCVIFGFVIYFSLLGSFFWLNILCIDIYIAFSAFRLRINSRPEYETRKFLYYMLYAWGLPFVFLLFTAVMELHPDIPHTLFKPKFKATCWFYSTGSKFFYFILPIGIIILCNVILFLLTARNIFKMKNDSEMQSGVTRKDKRNNKTRFQLCIKLSILMGVNWIMEILSFFIGGSKCIWLFTDMINTLQGLFIFLIFIGNKKVWHLIKRRVCCKKQADGSVDVGSNTTEESSRNASSSSVSPKFVNASGNLTLRQSNVTEITTENQRRPIEQEDENTRL